MSKKKLCQVSDIPTHGVKTFKIDNLDIAVFSVEGSYYAIDRKCTHLKGNLARGKVKDKTIQCPLHWSVFSLESGVLLNHPGSLAGWFKKAKNTKVYKISEEGNELYIEI